MPPKTQTQTQAYAPNKRSPARSKEQRELPCKLTADELRERGAQLATAELEVDKHKERRKGINGAIADLRSEVGRLSQIIDDRVEPRMVDCEWHDDDKQNAVVCFRVDTKEQIDARAMSAEDRQGALPLETDGAEPTAPVAASKRGRGRPKGVKTANKRHSHASATSNGVSAS